MKKKRFAIVIALLLMTGFAGCRQNEAPDPALTGPGMPADSVAGPEVSPLPETEGQAEAPSGAVNIGLATDSFMAQYSSFHEYTCDEDGADIVIWADATITDFAFITINHEEVGDTVSYSAGETLFSADELTPEKPLVVRLLIPGSIPAYGISYVDGGIKKYYTINLDGRGPEEAPPYFLLEFENMG